MKQILLLSLFTLVFSSGFSQIDNLLKFNNDFVGDFNDHSSYGLIPTVVGNVQLDTGRTGESNSSAYFDGNSYLNYGAPDYLNDGASFSISLWYKGGSSDAGDLEILFGKGNLAVSLSDLNRPYFSGAWDDSYWDDYTGLPNTTTWFHIAASYNASNDSVLLYKNGTLVGGDVLWENFRHTDSVYVGRTFMGNIDDINVFDGVITQEEITYLYTVQPKVVSRNELTSEKLNVYPNPASDNINFEKPINVKISDLLGNQVGNYTNVSTVDITGCSKGMYIIKFDDGTSQRFVKK